jgi:tetratricopeptide (TPR) repeat protein
MFLLLPSLSAISQDNKLKEEAMIYRDKGYADQSRGDLDMALAYYQKAVELDPMYAAVYNDLGVLYEIKGFKDKAEASYVKCIKIDPYYQYVYFNLATLYEEQGKLKEAADCWQKRIQIGDSADPWTQKARQHLQNIGMLREDIGKEIRQQETVDLIRSMSGEKGYFESGASEGNMGPADKKEKAKKFFTDAQASYSKGDYAAAFKYAVTAQYLDPSISDMDKFIEKAQEKITGTYSQ